MKQKFYVYFKMSLVFDYGFEKSYATTNTVISNTRITNQLNNLDLALKDYDISQERRFAFRERVSTLSKLEYMNMRYLASCLIIMDRFYEQSNISSYTELIQYLHDLFETDKFQTMYYKKMVNISNETSKSNYVVYLKRVVLNYCIKLLDEQDQE
jgi:hypothetical protein